VTSQSCNNYYILIVLKVSVYSASKQIWKNPPGSVQSTEGQGTVLFVYLFTDKISLPTLPDMRMKALHLLVLYVVIAFFYYFNN